MKTVLFSVLVLLSLQLTAQSNIETEGEIHTLNGGIRFPDSTLQTTAAFNANPLSITDLKLKAYILLKKKDEVERIPLIGIPQFGAERKATPGHILEFSQTEQISLTFWKEPDEHSVDYFKNMFKAPTNTQPTITIEFIDENQSVVQRWDLEETVYTRFLARSLAHDGQLVNIEEIQVYGRRMIIYSYGTNPSCFCYSFYEAASCYCEPP